MSTRAKLAATVASIGVIGIGWNVGTANGHTLDLGTTSGTTATTTTSGTSSRTSGTTTSGSTTSGSTGSGSTSSGTSSSRTGSSGSSTSTSGSSTSSSTSGTTASTTTYQHGTYTGSTATHRYGSVTVAVTIANGRISSVSERVVSDGDRKSDQINSRSVPTVRAKVVAANSANVSTVSGATYTTRAYLSSLQSALDQAK